MKTSTNKRSGFTIIEVVLVLAIAGLIFLIVFLALPQLQKSQRDTTRRSDVGRLVAAINSYAANSNGVLPAAPADVETLIPDYIDTWEYDAMVADGSETEDAMAYAKGVNCAGDATNNRQFVIKVKLEAGGSYCAEG